MKVLGVRKADAKRGGVITLKGKLKKKSLTIYHKPKPLFRAKFQQKRGAARWKKQPLFDSKLSFWGKSAKWPFNRKIKETWPKNISEEEIEKKARSSQWTVEETKFVCDLCDTYQQRFVIIGDRYNVEKPPDWARRTKAEIKQRYFHVVMKVCSLRQKRLFCSRSLFNIDMKKEKHRTKELEKLLTRSQEQTEHMARLTLQRRKIVKALKQHRKSVSSRRKKLTEQQRLIDARLRGHDRALVVGNQHGYNCDYGVIMADRMHKAPSRSEGIFSQIPPHIHPKIKEPPKLRVTSTVTSWNTPTEVIIPGFSGRPQFVFKTPFPASQEAESDALLAKMKGFLKKHGIDDYLTGSSKAIATSAVLDMYFALRNDLLLLYSWESLLPQFKTKVNELKLDMKAENSRLEKLNAAAKMLPSSRNSMEKKEMTMDKQAHLARLVVG